MIGTYEFAYSNQVLTQPDGSIRTTTDKGTAILLLEKIEPTGVNTTQDINKAKVNVKGQRSGHLIRRSSGAQSPEVEAGVM